MKPNVIAIIPARYASTRLPGKPILDIAGKPMVVRVAERARQVAAINRIIIATDDLRIFDAVIAHNHEVMLTSPDHQTGTDRLAEVAAKLDAEIIVNVQGDEPLIEPGDVQFAPEFEHLAPRRLCAQHAARSPRHLFDPAVGEHADHFKTPVDPAGADRFDIQAVTRRSR